MAISSNAGHCQKYIVQYLSVFVVTLGFLTEGMHFGWTSPAINKLLAPDSPIIIDQEEIKWIGQWYLVGGFFGALVSCVVFSKLSKKVAVLVSGVPLALGWLGIRFATQVTLLYVARFTGGLGRTMICVAVPMYIGEIADPSIRGILGSFMNIACISGITLVFSLVPWTALEVASYVGLIIAVLHVVLSYFIPASPYHHLERGNIDAARRALRTLRQREDVEEELSLIEIAVKKDGDYDKGFIRLFTSKCNLRALWIALVLRFISAMCGIGPITMYLSSIFEKCGTGVSSDALAIVFSLVTLASCFVSTLTIDKFGRRTLMYFSCISSALLLTTQAVMFYFRTKMFIKVPVWLAVGNVFVFVLVSRVGIGAIPVIIESELFSNDVKVQGVVLVEVSYTLSSILTDIIFIQLKDSLGLFATFAVFSVCSISTALFTYFFLPETKGKSLGEIQELLESRKLF